MSVRRVLAIVALVAGSTTGCVGVVPFACEDDAQCDRVAGGRCFAGGCAAPDPDCESGFRYAADASKSDAGSCVASVGTTSTSSSGSTSSGAGSDGGTTSTSGSETTVDPASSSSSAVSSSSVSSSSSSTTGDESSTTGCEPDDCTCTEQLEIGNRFNCVLREDGGVACWGQNNRGQAGTADVELETINQPRLVDLGGNTAVEVAAHFEHACARTDVGDVWCWGRNLYGMVDPTAPLDVGVDPQQVEGVADATAVRLGLRSSCARHADDTLTCWGWEEYNLLLTEELGNGPFTSGPYPGLVDFAVGFYHGCLWTDQEVQCWGRNNWGQVTSPVGGSFAQPQTVPLPGPPQAVALGRNHACALVDDETVWCWGRNETNQISGDVTMSIPTPTQVEPVWDGTITRLFAQGYITCVETDMAELWCWGGTQAGWLGVDGLANNVPIWPPRRIDPFAELVGLTVDIGAGVNHFCALLDTAEVYCWGNSAFWQIGPSAPEIGEETVRVDPCAAI